MRMLLENSTQARDPENVHYQRGPFQSTGTAERSAVVAPQPEDWIDQEPNTCPYLPVKPNLPALKLESFDGDNTHWTEFATDSSC